jgi:cell division protein FtsB
MGIAAIRRQEERRAAAAPRPLVEALGPEHVARLRDENRMLRQRVADLIQEIEQLKAEPELPASDEQPLAMIEQEPVVAKQPEIRSQPQPWKQKPGWDKHGKRRG